jgi:4-hydroxy-tetrahydrodipicolinate synthase
MMGKIIPMLRLPMDLPSEALQKEIRSVLASYDLVKEAGSEVR